ncbi:MAG TPA: iron ABC transporter permease [Candidatus Binatia bacterium]|jgi:iron(III) transport system permease protein|nr:iron ABC transporter permease [Candidatus Binatia bacterium]
MALVMNGRLRSIRRVSGLRQIRLMMHVGVLVAVALVTLVPLVLLVLNSFNEAPLGKPFAWGIKGWGQAFHAPQTLNALKFSFLLSTRTFLGLLAAFLISWLLVRVRIPGHSFIEFSLWIAWFLPPLSVTIGWMTLLDPHYGLINQALKTISPFPVGMNIYSFAGIMWVHLSLLTVPVMTILLTPAFRQMDASFEESARSCGSGPLKTLRRIVLPLLWPSVLVVTIAGLIRSLEAFEIEQLIGIPAGIYVYGTRIYDLVRWDPPLYGQAMALSTIFLGALGLLIVLYQILIRYGEFATIRSAGMSFRPSLIGKWRYLASGFLFAWVAIGIYLPLGMVLLGSFMKFFGMFHIDQPFTLKHWVSVISDPTFENALGNSLLLGFGVATIGVVLYSLLGIFMIRARYFGTSLLHFMVWIPWAIPGILLGLSLLWLFLSVPVVKFFYGTLFVLIFALILKDMPLGAQMIRAAFLQVGGELEQASRVVGAGSFTTFRRITMPLVAPMLVSVFILVFMSSVRDISTPILLAFPSTTPLSVLMLERSVAGEIEKASVIGVILSGLAIVTALIMRRLGFRFGAGAV